MSVNLNETGVVLCPTEEEALEQLFVGVPGHFHILHLVGGCEYVNDASPWHITLSTYSILCTSGMGTR